MLLLRHVILADCSSPSLLRRCAVLDDTRSLGAAAHFALRAGAGVAVVLVDSWAEMEAAEAAAADNGFREGDLAAVRAGIRPDLVGH